MQAIRLAPACIALALAAAGCEGTWATPNQTRDAHRYALVVENGSCARGGTAVARFGLYPYPDPSEGLEGSGHIDVPIHDLLKNGYAVMLVDRRKNVSVSCADLETDRLF